MCLYCACSYCDFIENTVFFVTAIACNWAFCVKLLLCSLYSIPFIRTQLIIDSVLVSPFIFTHSAHMWLNFLWGSRMDYLIS